MRSDLIHVLIVDDLNAYRSAFAMVLEQQDDLRVVAQVDSVADARLALNRAFVPIHVALVAMKLPDGSGKDVISDVHAIFPACHVAMLRGNWNTRDDALAVAAGAAALFPRSATIEQIIQGVRALREGESLIPQEHRVSYLQKSLSFQAEEHEAIAAMSRLTPRELEILHSLAHGKSDKETADEWGVSPKTVAAHMAHLLEKMGVESRLQAVLLALRYGLIDQD